MSNDQISAIRRLEVARRLLGEPAVLTDPEIAEIDRIEAATHDVTNTAAEVHFQVALAYRAALSGAQIREVAGNADRYRRRNTPMPAVPVVEFFEAVEPGGLYIRHTTPAGLMTLGVRGLDRDARPITEFVIHREGPMRPWNGWEVALWWLAGSPVELADGRPPFGDASERPDEAAAVAELAVVGLSDDAIGELVDGLDLERAWDEIGSRRLDPGVPGRFEAAWAARHRDEA